MSCHLMPVPMAGIQMVQIGSVGEDAEKRAMLGTAGRNAAAAGHSTEGPQRVDGRSSHVMRPGNATTGDAPGKTETRTGRNTRVPARATAFSPTATPEGSTGTGRRGRRTRAACDGQCSVVTEQGGLPSDTVGRPQSTSCQVKQTNTT